MARPKKTIVPKVPKAQQDFSLSLKLGNEIYESKGDTMLEALANLSKPDKIFLKGVLTVESNKKTRTHLLLPAQIKRLFWPTAQKFIAKQFYV